MQMNRTQAPTFASEPETPEQIFARTSAREVQLSRLLIFFISGGLMFMLLPGTFLGVWNLIFISDRRAADSISPAWIQAHGHAQVLGWIGSFILGIGFYSIPKLRGGLKPFALWPAWLSGAMWMAGVLLRWLANVYLWQWRVLLRAPACFCRTGTGGVSHLFSCGLAAQTRQIQRQRQKTAGHLDFRRDRRGHGTARHPGAQSRGGRMAGRAWGFARFSASLRSALSGARGLGIHGAIRMGLQHQVAADFFRDAAAHQPAVGIGGGGPRDCHRFGTRGFLSRHDRLDRAFFFTCHGCAWHFRHAGEGCQAFTAAFRFLSVPPTCG